MSASLCIKPQTSTPAKATIVKRATDPGREHTRRKPKARAVTPEVLADAALIDGRMAASAACISLSQWHELVRSGMAPQPFVRGNRCTRWRLVEVRQWLLDGAWLAASDGDAVVRRAERASAAAVAARKQQGVAK